MGLKSLQDRMTPSVYGVGYLGANTDLNTSVNGKPCYKYRKWTDMLRRCYSEKYQVTVPTYIGCTISDEFKDYSKWREWYDNYPYKQDDWHLDKDLLVKSNKVYSKETCVFLPRAINMALVTRQGNRGKCLIGVVFPKKGKYTSFLKKHGKNTYLGTYDNEYDAYLAYKLAKEEYLKELAEDYKDMLDPRAYIALQKYVVDIDD